MRVSKKNYSLLIGLFFLTLLGNQSFAQDTSSSDGLLVEARKAAFDNKDYPQAKAYLYKALHLSPEYADVKIFLGRIHAWSKEYDSARYYFNSVLKAKPDYEDASVALADLEFWDDHDAQSLQVAEDGLKYHPNSTELLLRKAKALKSMRRFPEAQAAVDKVIEADKNNTEARALANVIKEFSIKNKIGVSYDYVYFDKQFSDPWHLVAFDYSRTTKFGSVTGRINYANRFAESGVQYEVDAYPRISNTFYAYVNAGYSNNVGVFAQWRGGFSLYANIPKGFEGELGVRYLKFSGDPTWIYTGYVGKYYKSWLFGFRTYLTPSVFTNVSSTSYTATARYYYGTADDMIGLSLGYGLSPDDRSNAIQLDGKEKLLSYKTGMSFKKRVARRNVLSFDFTWVNQEYLPQTKGNQYQISVGCLHRF
jgi:YaiO family outer membrane protein